MSAPPPARRASLQIGRVVADDRDALGLEAESQRLAGVERAVGVASLAAHELAARDDDRRARAAHPETVMGPRTVRSPFRASNIRLPSTLTTTLPGRSTESRSAFCVKRWSCPRSSVPV